ncbi:MAG: polysaccharide deacetylase family protein [Phenylobacterium sp.]|uniref:polysaccharide deacetylase family protein n=1 Tax=Phenylobacterium sp. TaxID=1871053 RepID=UPI001226EBE7|nr:polysaccharide deacetylase family protein [Phenylobacterium sp.]TAJ70623.1 MAG: polysaccharide deacetylase family protein [Phenylobacterium sp.]
MLTLMSDVARKSLGPASRRRLKGMIDPILAPVGSIHGAKGPSNKVALTFDDGPDPVVTPRLLDLLRTRGVRATFFVLTDKAADRPELLRRIAEEGHEIGLHFDRHDRLTRMRLGEARRRVRAARAWLESLTGPVRFFRPPFGSQSLSTYMMARFEGLEVVSWGPYAEDWAEQAPETAAGKVLGPVKGGDIVLMHDGLEKPEGEALPTFDRVRMVELILDGLAARNLAPGAVGDLLADGGPRLSAWFRR